jgi:dTDP-4-amino-4,6-dideoxygalactose transaminase
MTKAKHIPFAKPCIGEEEIAAVVDTMRSGWLTTGPKTREFEEAFAAAVGARHALAVNSATAGLHLALEATGVQAGDAVFTPVWTFTASAEVARYLGAHPVFVDIDAGTLNIDPVRLQESVARSKKAGGWRAKAIMPVHFAGQACNMDAIVEFAIEQKLKVVEDAAHAFPTIISSRSMVDPLPMRRNIGAIGDATVFSFYATKTLATGEGGMVTTEDDALADRVRVMRLHGISRDVWNRYTSDRPSWYYEIVAPGFKYNLTDIAASIGLEQLRKARFFQARREEIAAAYDFGLEGQSAFERPLVESSNNVHAWHLYVLRLNLDQLSIDRDRFIHEMASRGVSCSVHFIPLHMQPYWRDTYGLEPAQFPVASREFERVVSLPIYPGMTDEMVERVVATLLDIATIYKR